MFDFNIGFTSCHEQSDNNNWVTWAGVQEGRCLLSLCGNNRSKSSQDWLRRL